MKDTGAGWDSCLYRIFVIGWIAAVVAGVLLAAFLAPGNSRLPLYIGGGGMIGFIVVLLAYWWFQIAIKGYGSALPPQETAAPSPSPNILESWNALFDAMSIQNENREQAKVLQKQAGSPLLVWFGMLAGLTLYILVFMGLYLAEIISPEQVRYLGYSVPVLAILMYAIGRGLVRRANRANEALVFAPLGLSLISTPEMMIFPTADGSPRASARGDLVLAGRRHGRAVQINIGSAKTTTLVEEPSAQFEIKNARGEFEATANPHESVRRILDGIRPTKHWDGVILRGNGQGVSAERTGGSHNMWLYDLWLIEHILEAEK